MKKIPSVYIITPVFNSWQYTKLFLDSLKKIKYQNYQVIVVNDGSTDKTSANLKKYYPQVKEIKGDGKWWDSGSRNKAIEYLLKNKISPDYILTCNNDIVFDSQFLNHLLDFAKKKKNKCILGPKILDAKKKKTIFQFGTGCDLKKGKLYLMFKGKNDGKRFNKNLKVDNLTGLCSLIPFDVFKKYQIFWDAKKFPTYYGDSDFCLRVKKAGFIPYVVGKSKVYIFTEHCVADLAKNLPFFKLFKFIFSPRSSWNPFRDFSFFHRHYGIKPAWRSFLRKSTWILMFLKYRWQRSLKER